MRSRALFLVALLAFAGSCTDQSVGIEPEVQFANRGRAPFMASAVAAGAQHACAIGVDRSTYCWGDNAYGQLGDGSNDASLAPVAVAGGHSFVEITSGAHHHTCGLTRSGILWCWGQNPFGQLGDGTTEDSNVPVQAAPSLKFRSVDAGTYHTCGMATDGTAYCWGSNGPLSQSPSLVTGWAFGTPTTTMCDNPAAPYRGAEWHCSLTPVAVPGPAFTSIRAGLWASCGLTASGNAFCAGWNGQWELGNGTADNAPAMTLVSGGLELDALELGALSGCGLVGTSAHCWGQRSFESGVLGSGTMAGSSVPVPVAGGLSFASMHPTDANNIFSHTCGLTTSGKAYCWGNNRFGGLGTEAALVPCSFGVEGCASSPVAVAGPNKFVALTTGSNFSCGVAKNLSVYCWGSNVSGQLGDGTQDDQFAPVRVQAPRGRSRRPATVPSNAKADLIR